MTVSIYSRERMEKRLSEGALERTAVISFSDPVERAKKYRPEYLPIDYSGRCERVMQIALHDLDPDVLGEVGLTVESFFPEACELAAFIKSAVADGLDIVCQCEYGQSRSAGCAAAILQYYEGRGIDIFADYRYYPNQLVYHKVFDALTAESGGSE